MFRARHLARHFLGTKGYLVIFQLIKSLEFADIGKTSAKTAAIEIHIINWLSSANFHRVRLTPNTSGFFFNTWIKYLHQDFLSFSSNKKKSRNSINSHVPSIIHHCNSWKLRIVFPIVALKKKKSLIQDALENLNHQAKIQKKNFLQENSSAKNREKN